MRILRLLIAIIILFILVVIFLVGSLLYFVDPNKIKPIISSEVLKRSGYHLAMDSRLSWSFYPNISIVVPRMSITAPNDTTPFLVMNNVKIATKLSSLWEERQRLLGDIYADEAFIGRVKLEKIKAKLSWQKQAVSLDILQSNFYSGSLHGGLIAANLSGEPAWDFKIAIANSQVQPLLNDLSAGETRIQISGNGTGDFQGKAKGKNKLSILKTMQAQLNLGVKQGIIYGIDVNYLLQSANALIHKEPITTTNTGQTHFDTLVTNATISDGFLRTNNFVLNAAGFTANTKGNLNLIDNMLDLHVEVAPTEKKHEFAVPVLVRGSVTHPEIGLDMKEVSKFVAKLEFEKVKEKVQQQIEKRVPSDVSDFLQNIIGR